MRKVIATINMTIDGICDHTVIQPGEDIHRHYQDLLNGGDVILYGRITYQLMEFWRTFLDRPSEEPSMQEFALTIDRIPKIVFSRTLKAVDWHSARLADRDLLPTVTALKNQSGKDIYIGSRSLIHQLMKAGLIDEYQLCVHPVIAGKGLPLFEPDTDRTLFNLTGTKTFDDGAIILYYQPVTVH